MASSKIVRLFWKVGNIILGTSWPAPLFKKMKRRQAVPEKIREFFENHHAGWSEYVILKVQIAILLLFIANVIYLVILPSENLIFLSLLLTCSGYLIYQTRTQLKIAFKRDYPAYRSFVGICIMINWTLPLLIRFLPTFFPMEYNLNIIVPIFLAIATIVSAFAAFRIKYGRNFTYGLVEKSGSGRALVRVGYDIRSNVKPGVYPVESSIRVKKGDAVKLSVVRPMLGLGGAKVKKITGIVDQSTSA